MARSGVYPYELRERAVRMVAEVRQRLSDALQHRWLSTQPGHDATVWHLRAA